MENQTTQQQLIASANSSLKLFAAKLNAGDEINCDGWRDEFERQKCVLACGGVSETEDVMIAVRCRIESLI